MPPKPSTKPSIDSLLQTIKEKSRYGISVWTPYRRYGHRLRTPFLRTPFPRLLSLALQRLYWRKFLLNSLGNPRAPISIVSWFALDVEVQVRVGTMAGTKITGRILVPNEIVPRNPDVLRIYCSPLGGLKIWISALSIGLF